MNINIMIRLKRYEDVVFFLHLLYSNTKFAIELCFAGICAIYMKSEWNLFLFNEKKKRKQNSKKYEIPQIK